MSLDTKDKQIIKEMIYTTKKISNIYLSKLLQITETAVRKRLNKLKENKIILGIKYLINYRKADLYASLTGLDVEPDNLIEVINYLNKQSYVRSIWLTTGDHTLIVEIISDSYSKIVEIHKELEKLKGIKRICPSIILEIIK